MYDFNKCLQPKTRASTNQIATKVEHFHSSSPS
jgi:hypothetical protein